MTDLSPQPGSDAGQPQQKPDDDGWRGSGRVLVVDDEEAVGQLVAHAVERLGFTVEMAGDGERALPVFESEPSAYALIILDLKLPGIDGLEVLRRVRAIRPDMRAILISGYYRLEPLARSTFPAPTAFLPKPFTLNALIGAVRSVLKA